MNLLLQLEFVRQLSSDSNNTVVGLVRNKTDTEKRLGEDAARKNLHILEADLVDPDAIEVSFTCTKPAFGLVRT